MSQPVWVTAAGSLTPPAPYTLVATPVSPATTITYSLVTGLLPTGYTLSSAGVISGTTPVPLADTIYRFTVRATDTLGNFRDRSFSLVVSASTGPQLTLPSYSSLLVTADNTWIDIDIAYTNPSGGTVYFVLSSGTLPSGLELSSAGKIRGYAGAVTADTTSQFTVQLIGADGVATATYSITVTNSAIKYPSLLNSKPKNFTPQPNDPYAGYYTTADVVTLTGSIATGTISSFNGSISGNTLTVTGILTTPPVVGQTITGTGVSTGTTITAIQTAATSYAISTITSTATDFSVELYSAPPSWVVGTLITIDGVTPAAYNADWIINTIGVNAVTGGKTITVSSLLNPGTSTVAGTVRSYGSNIIGLYTVDVNQTTASTVITGFDSILTATAVSGGNITIGSSFTGVGSTSTTAGSFTVGQTYTITSLGTTNFSLIGAPSATFDASLYNYTLTVTNVSTGTLAPGQDISGLALTPTTSGNFIIGQQYTIATVGTTDWVALGAASSTAGLLFTATATGLVTAPNLIIGQSYTIRTVNTTDFTLCGAGVNIPGTTFIATATGIGSGVCAQGTGTASATISSGTTIIGYGTGTGGVGTYTVDVQHPYTTITGTGWTATPGVGTEFVATGVGAGTGTAAATIPSGTVITAYGTGTGGVGTYNTNQPINIPSTDITLSTSLGSFTYGEYLAYKLIGVDWNIPQRPLIYSAIGLPAGLVLDPATGWIVGSISAPAGGADQTYTFRTWVVNDLGYSSPIYTYSFKLSTSAAIPITWVTSQNLGTINNGTLSSLSVAASGGTLQYRLAGSSLPSNLMLNSDGSIYGRVAFEPNATVTAQNTTSTYTFDIEAYDPSNPVLRSSTRQFTLKVYQRWSEPWETVYLLGTPDYNDRTIMASLLSNAVIPDSALYRPTDSSWGRATGVTVAHTYGLKVGTAALQAAALTENFYNRQLVLGGLKTAIAKDTNGTIIYEVVYSEIIDDALNSAGVSVSKTITWPYTVTTSTGVATTTLYPASTVNMRKQLESVVGTSLDDSLLPLWMTCQQQNGSTLGYKLAWVLCYTKPGMSTTVLNSIRTLWPYTLNLINFALDRFYVDKNATYNYDVATNTWLTLPSAASVSCPITDTCAPGSLPNEITAAPTATQYITDWYIGMPIKFVGTPFGGLKEDLVYYISAINTTTNRFTVSTSLVSQTVLLYTASGAMTGTPIYPAPAPTNSKDNFVLYDRPNILSRV